MSGYKHFIRKDANNIVIDGYTDWQDDRRNVDEIALTGVFGRHFQIQLTNERGQFIYKWENGAMVSRTQNELDAEWNSRSPEQPSIEDRLAAAESVLLSMMGL